MFDVHGRHAAFSLRRRADDDRLLDDGRARSGIVHTGSDGEPVVLYMQGRKVVMQVRVDRAAGLSYKARFFHVDPDLTKKGRVMAEVGADSNPALQVNGRPLRCDVPVNGGLRRHVDGGLPRKRGHRRHPHGLSLAAKPGGRRGMATAQCHRQTADGGFQSARAR